MNLNNYRSASNNNVGGRDCISIPETTKVETGNRGICCPAKSEILHKSILFSSNAENQTTSKKIGYLFKKTFTVENLYNSYLIARKGKRKKRGTLKFEMNLGGEILSLHKELMGNTYIPKPYSKFEIYEPKKRVIYAPAFRDLVVQHAIYKGIYPIFDKTFINTSYACRKGGGTHKASLYLQKEMRRYDSNLYYAKLDVRKFFYRIDRNILRKLFEKKIKDKKFVDDFVAVGLTLKEAQEFKTKCENFLKEKLNLELSHYTIQKIKKGINFVGYRTWKTKRFIRKHSMYKFRKAAKKQQLKPIISLIGHAQNTKTMPYFRKILVKFDVLNKLPQRSIECLNM